MLGELECLEQYSRGHDGASVQGFIACLARWSYKSLFPSCSTAGEWLYVKAHMFSFCQIQVARYVLIPPVLGAGTCVGYIAYHIGLSVLLNQIKLPVHVSRLELRLL